jgi:predicted negative regulator of RcsB-dependent stress response
MAAAKLSKKELEGPDIFQSGMEKVTDFIAENKARFYVAVAAASIAIIAAIGIYFYWNNYQTSAVEMYAKAQNNLIKNAEKPEAAKESIVVFKELIDKYPQSWSAKTAHYQLGNIYYNLGDIDNAIASYKNYIASGVADNAGIRFLALTSLGYCYELRKDYKSALGYFEQAQKSNNTGFEVIGYRNIARIYEQMNDRKKALENYQNALQKTTDPSMSLFIKRKISSLS